MDRPEDDSGSVRGASGGDLGVGVFCDATDFWSGLVEPTVEASDDAAVAGRLVAQCR